MKRNSWHQLKLFDSRLILEIKLTKWDYEVFYVNCLQFFFIYLATAYVGEPIRFTIGLRRTDDFWALERVYRQGGFEFRGTRFLWTSLGMFDDLTRAVISRSKGYCFSILIIYDTPSPTSNYYPHLLFCYVIEMIKTCPHF